MSFRSYAQVRAAPLGIGAACGIACLLASACAARVGVGGAIDGSGPAPQNYRAVFERWTQDGSLHDGFRTVLLAKATLMGPEMQESLAAERTFWVGPSAPEQPVEADLAPWTVVFSAVSDFDDMGVSTAAKPAAWSASLWVDGVRCALIEVSPNTLDALSRRLYPNLSDWDQQWTARFSGCPNVGVVEFQLSGAHGALELGWEVTPDSVRALPHAPVAAQRR